MVPLEAVLEKLNPLASKDKEAMEKYVPPVTAISKPSATLPWDVLSSSPQKKVPLFQARASPSSEHSLPAILKADPLKKEALALVKEPLPTVYISPETKTSLVVVIQLEAGAVTEKVPNLE